MVGWLFGWLADWLVGLSGSALSLPSIHCRTIHCSESQGGLLSRAFVTKINNPPVHNLVAISGPQAGVGLCPDIDFPIIKTVCASGAPVSGDVFLPVLNQSSILLRSYVLPSAAITGHSIRGFLQYVKIADGRLRPRASHRRF